MKKTSVLLASLMLALSTSAFAANQADAEKAIADAKSSYDAAKKTGFAWRDTEKSLINEAEKAMAKKDYDKAVSLATEAQKQNELAVQQSKDQAGAGPLF